MARVPFNVPPVGGRELEYLADVIANVRFSGDGAFTAKCQLWLKDHLAVDSLLLTNSCTAALEMAAILAEFGPGDEVIMPSFTFVSTANAVVLRGAIPVFVDIRSDTQNIDENVDRERYHSTHEGYLCSPLRWRLRRNERDPRDRPRK
jgi:dTDP-4-amino-4,6-dideoxygalactose transaminase